MFHRDEEEDCEAYIPEEDPFFGKNTTGPTEYRPRGTRIQHMFPQSYSTRGRHNNARQKSSVRVIYDDPITPDISKRANRGKFKQRARLVAPHENNCTKPSENYNNSTRKECAFLESINNAAIRVNEAKSMKNASQSTQKTKYYQKTKRPFQCNKPNFLEGEILGEQLRYSSQNNLLSVGHPIHPKHPTRGSAHQINSYDNYSFVSYNPNIPPYDTTSHSYKSNFPTYRPFFSSNRYKYTGNGAKFHSNGHQFSSSHYFNKFAGPKTTLKVPNSAELSHTVRFNEMNSNEVKTTANKSNKTAEATKSNSDGTKSSTDGSLNSLNEFKSVDEGSSVSIANDPVGTVATAGVQAKKKKHHKRKKAVENIDDLIAKARSIGIIEQKISHKPFVPEDVTECTGKVEINTNVRTLTAEEKKQRILREWQKQQEEIMEMNRKDPITQTQFVGFYGVTLSKDNDNDVDEDVIFYGLKTAVKDRARGGCRRGASSSNKGGHTQRHIYEFKFVKERIRRTHRI